jgi:arginyl-tRNA synthetase
MLTEIRKEAEKLICRAAGVKEAPVEPAREGFGDITSRIAFDLASKEKKNPAEIAKEIVKKIPESKFFSKTEAVGPYINFHMSDEAYLLILKKILKEKNKFGKGKRTGKKMMVEYFHANTHKGVHIGHIRTASLGESVSRILEFSGNKVIRANYQGDIGPHVAKCIWGFINLHQERAPGENRGVWLGNVYAEASKKIRGNEELERQVQEINMKLYSRDKKITEIWKKTRQWCLDDFEKFYREFGIKFDELYFESQTEGIGEEISLDLLKRGIAKKDQGAVIMDLKDDDLGVAVLLTKEGYPLYHAKDLGLAKLKFDKYDLDKSIHVVGKEQEFYFNQLFKIFEKAGMKRAAEVSYHLIYELVMLPEGKMSSREGTMVLYEDLKEKLLEIVRKEIRKRHDDWNDKKVGDTAKKIAFAAIKFSMLRRESNKTITFDWDQALSLEGDTGPYLQYAYVRTNGILKKAKFKMKPNSDYHFSGDEKKLIKELCLFSQAVDRGAASLSPNVLCAYLLDLAAELNKFYTTTSVINAEKKEERETRLAIVAATNLILANALNLLGIEAPEEM